jgi:hypothetical protein
MACVYNARLGEADLAKWRGGLPRGVVVVLARLGPGATKIDRTSPIGKGYTGFVPDPDRKDLAL